MNWVFGLFRSVWRGLNALTNIVATLYLIGAIGLWIILSALCRRPLGMGEFEQLVTGMWQLFWQKGQ